MAKSHDPSYDGRINDHETALRGEAMIEAALRDGTITLSEWVAGREAQRQMATNPIPQPKWWTLEEAREQLPEFQSFFDRTMVQRVVELLELGYLPSYSVERLQAALDKRYALEDEKRRHADGE